MRNVMYVIINKLLVYDTNIIIYIYNFEILRHLSYYMTVYADLEIQTVQYVCQQNAIESKPNEKSNPNQL